VVGKRKRSCKDKDTENNKNWCKIIEKRRPRHYVKNWIATIQMPETDIDDLFKNKFQELLNFLHSNTSLLYTCGGFEVLRNTSKKYIQSMFCFNLRVYETTLKKWINKYNLYRYLKPCNDIEGSYFYTRKENDVKEIGDYSKVKFKGMRSEIEEIFESVKKEGFKETLKKNPTSINKCLKTVLLYEQEEKGSNKYFNSQYVFI
jgi:hypothetical protein